MLVAIAVGVTKIGVPADATPAQIATLSARGVRTATVLVFVFYPSVSRTIFAGLPCVQLDTNEYWMENDLH